LTILQDVQSEEFQKKQLLTQASLILSDDKIARLKEILARTKNVDEAVDEFKRFKDESTSKTMHNGNGKYLVAKSEEEMIQRLHDGYRLVQSLNHDKYLLEAAN
jgi:uncharacterized protein YlzI (FlbEa/FlbD family)